MYYKLKKGRLKCDVIWSVHEELIILLRIFALHNRVVNSWLTFEQSFVNDPRFFCVCPFHLCSVIII